MQKRNPYFLNAVYPILIPVTSILFGGLIYLFFRTSSPRIFNLFSVLEITELVTDLRSGTLPFSSFLPSWFIFSLPDALWAFSYSFLIFYIWRNKKSLLAYLWILTIPILTIGFELLQLNQLVVGTFSPVDLIFTIIGVLAGYILVHQLKPYLHEKTN